MATIREITDLRLPSSTARAHWHGFVNETITSSQPGEQWTPFRWRRIERDSDRDVVQFEQTAPGMTRMTVRARRARRGGRLPHRRHDAWLAAPRPGAILRKR